VIDDIAASPVGTMLEAGLAATVNSDDPAYFGGYVNDNYQAIAGPLGLGRDALVTLARNSFAGSFLPPAERDRHIAAVDAYAAAFA